MVRIKSTPTMVNPSFVMDYDILLLKLPRLIKKREELLAHQRAIKEREKLLPRQQLIKECDELIARMSSVIHPHSTNEAELLENTSEQLNNEAQNSRKEINKPNEEIVQKSWSAHLASSDSLLEIVIPNSGHPEMVRIKSTPTVVNPYASYVMDYDIILQSKLHQLKKKREELLIFMRAARNAERDERIARLPSRWGHIEE